MVPADLRLVDSSALQVDESAMTGESVPVDRDVGDEVLAGTVVSRGRGWGSVVRTGPDSGLGRVAALVASAAPRPTPLQRRLSILSRQLVVVTAVLCVVVMVLSVLRGASYVDASILAVSLGVAAIPESLPAVVTVALALGAHRMASRSAVVRSLPAVETLGSVTVLASDKTGTLTRGVLVARRLWTPDGSCTVSGDGHDVYGEVVGSEEAEAGAMRLLRDAALCNDATLGVRDEDTWRAVGDPFDVALLVAAAKQGLTTELLSRRWTRVEGVPFDEANRSMRTIHRDRDGRCLEVLKGAPEAVLDLLPPGPDVEAARLEADALAAQGYRVLAVAEDRSWVGLVGVVDPPHPDARAVVEECRGAGVRIVMITGDHPGTARAVGAAVGILREGGEVSDGDAVARGEHAGRVEAIDVYARTRPEQKVDIVDAWQAHGDVVAMTGDGVNDAPALRRADIGVAMGGRGTEVARQAADLVLVDDNLETLLVAIGEGRRIHANIRTFLRYGLAGGLAEMLVILVAPLLGMPLPLTPAMILWVNMVTHGVPGVAFGAEPLDPALMHRPSPSPSAVDPRPHPGEADRHRRGDDRGGLPRDRVAHLPCRRAGADRRLPHLGVRPARRRARAAGAARQRASGATGAWSSPCWRRARASSPASWSRGCANCSARRPCPPRPSCCCWLRPRSRVCSWRRGASSLAARGVVRSRHPTASQTGAPSKEVEMAT